MYKTKSRDTEFQLIDREEAVQSEAALTTKAAIRAILAHYDSVYEKRIQALVFAAEILWKQERKASDPERLTDADFERYAFGVFSPTVREALLSLELPSRRAYLDEKRTRKFATSRVQKPEPTGVSQKRALEVIDMAIQRTEDATPSEIMEWSLHFDEVRDKAEGQRINLKSISIDEE